MKYLAAAVAAVTALALLAGCTMSTAPWPDADEQRLSAQRTLTFAVAGDSLTTWDNESFPDPTGRFADVAWLRWVSSSRLQLAGGYARGGASAKDIATHFPDVEADVLVVMAGSNDLDDTSPYATLRSIEQIIDEAGIDAVVLCAIPPRVGLTAEANAHNLKLIELAVEHDWLFVDPWISARANNGGWIDDLSFDGIHPTPRAAHAAADAISQAIFDAAEGR